MIEVAGIAWGLAAEIAGQLGRGVTGGRSP
jgi:hypothetical protein